ncbi:Ig-like domain-containing protein [Kitasatospora sp. NPDC048540]|uniref:Ig-like domain-containing protein n=1 Tax=Kitasatospora sp. NPDC048540 TaxID=3155634 RepID=UPI0033ECCFDB
MSRPSPDAAPAPQVRPAGRTGKQRVTHRAAAATLAAGLLIGWNSTPAAGQQSPDTWSADRRAVLPSGLRVQLDFAPLPGVDVTAAPGKLAEPAGRAASYTDGLHTGDPAETFLAAEKRPRPDGSWRTLGTLQISFSRAVRNPRLHVSGLSGLATGTGGSTGTATRLTVTGGSPAAPALVGRTGWSGWTVGDGELAPAGDGTTDGTASGSGTLELAGTLTTVTLRVEQRSTPRSGSTTAPAALRQAYTVTVDEGLGTAPQSYGNASHVISDLFLGQDAGGSAVRSRPGLTGEVPQPLVPGEQPPPPMPYDAEPADGGPSDAAKPDAPPPDQGPLVELDHGAALRSPWASAAPPQLQPGRGEYLGADPTLEFPAEAAVGHYYGLTVPVRGGDGPAVLAGWIDFDHNGRFDPLERVQAEVAPGSGTAALEWTVPDKAVAGETWARLRIARSGAQLVVPGGFADSGEVVDQRVRISVGAARPEISAPVPGTVTADPKPEIRGEGAVQGATVAVLEGDTELCRTTAGADGSWTCLPAKALGQGPHLLTPVETTKGGMVLKGTPVRLTVKTAPPAAPVLTLPEFTNDPGLLITGTGEAGSTVSVALTGLSGGARAGGELCSTAVTADGSWSCLPVENLTDGKHQLTAAAVDQAGNRTTGKAVALTVDTAAPDRPQLGSPAAGATLTTGRPRLTGRAEAGTAVTVTARPAGGEQATICGGVAAADSTWTCTATRDLPDGELTLQATATDRAGNSTAGDPVTVTVKTGNPPAASPSTSPSASPSGSASASTSASASASASAEASASASASASTPAPGAASPVPSQPSPNASASPAAGGPSVSPSPAPAAAPGAVTGSDLPPLPLGLLPITVPPVIAPPTVPSPTVPSPAAPGSAPASAPPSPSPSPSPSASASPSPSPGPAAAGSPGGVARAGSADPFLTGTSSDRAETLAEQGGPDHALAVPPDRKPAASAASAVSAASAAPDTTGAATAARGTPETGWRKAVVGGLLILLGLGLVTRRVFGRGSGSRRR